MLQITILALLQPGISQKPVIIAGIILNEI